MWADFYIFYYFFIDIKILYKNIFLIHFSPLLLFFAQPLITTSCWDDALHYFIMVLLLCWMYYYLPKSRDLGCSDYHRHHHHREELLLSLWWTMFHNTNEEWNECRMRKRAHQQINRWMDAVCCLLCIIMNICIES